MDRWMRELRSCRGVNPLPAVLTPISDRDRATRKMAMKMALRGDQIGRSEFSSDQLPYCDDPRRVGRRTDKSAGPILEVSMWAPCRRCAKCLQFRQMYWRERVLNELQWTHALNRRSWWITLTFDPIMLAGVMAEARLASGSIDDKSVDRAAYKHVQGWFKRVRAASKARFRYFAVLERGDETARPHYHLILHETGPRPLLHKTLSSKWRAIDYIRLVDMQRSGLAAYLTKYATKSSSVRLKASNRYGLDVSPLRTEFLKVYPEQDKDAPAGEGATPGIPEAPLGLENHRNGLRF